MYEDFLEQAARSAAIPRVLVAVRAEMLLGSVNLLAREMTIRPDLTPRLGQLFVAEDQRGKGIGGRLVDAAVSYICGLGYDRLFLFTSGSLPAWYRAGGAGCGERGVSGQAEEYHAV